jgi:16S rRNA (guanine(966)-N(2))-methyltransferase RsmD
MRIITGTAKGFKLKAPRGLDVRPTGDRVKESVFNIIANRIFDTDILDLFAGTGNLGLEALSRGARSAVFVDNAVTSLQVLKENAVHTRLAGRSEYIKTDVLKAIDRLQQQGRRFGLVFCDPPYNKGYLSAVLSKLDASSILRPDGVIIFEHSRHEICSVPLVQFQVMRTETYGETIITFYVMKPNLNCTNKEEAIECVLQFAQEVLTP